MQLQCSTAIDSPSLAASPSKSECTHILTVMVNAVKRQRARIGCAREVQTWLHLNFQNMALTQLKIKHFQWGILHRFWQWVTVRQTLTQNWLTLSRYYFWVNKFLLLLVYFYSCVLLSKHCSRSLEVKKNKIKFCSIWLLNEFVHVTINLEVKLIVEIFKFELQSLQ